MIGITIQIYTNSFVIRIEMKPFDFDGISPRFSSP